MSRSIRKIRCFVRYWVHSLILGYGFCFLYAFNRKMNQETAEEETRKKLLYEAELENELILYQNLLTSRAPWLVK